MLMSMMAMMMMMMMWAFSAIKALQVSFNFISFHFDNGALQK